MPQSGVIYEVEKGFNRQIANYFIAQVNIGTITAATLGAVSTALGLRNIEGNDQIQPNTSYTGYETARRFYQQYQKRMDNAIACGIVTDAIVAANNGSLAIFETNTFGNLDSTINPSALFSTVA